MSVAGYVAPATISEALAALGQAGRHSRLLGGGQSLLLPLRRREIDGAVLVDLNGIPELKQIEESRDGTLRIGAGATLDAVSRHPAVMAGLPEFAKQVGLLGDAQLRHRATLGGCVAERHPESDVAALLLALGAELEIEGQQGRQTMTLSEFLAAEASKASSSLICTIVLPNAPGRLVYERVKNPATRYAICGVAVYADGAAGGTLRIAAAGAFRKPTRLTEMEEFLKQEEKKPDGAMIEQASGKLPDAVQLHSSFYASSEYRRHLLEVLCRRTLSKALPLETN